jgi:23S rRNA G2445 N2-methylase RlmL
MTSRSYYITVPTGFECLAAEELAERIAPAKVEHRRGKLVFQTARPPAELLALRSAFHVFAFLERRTDLPMDETGLDWLRALPETLDWNEALETWRQRFEREETPGTFRITAQRAGEQTYNSQQAAAALGAGVQNHFNWAVNLDHPDLEIHAQIRDGELLVGVSLTPTSLHYRDQLQRGRTGLKQPIAHGLARLSRLTAEDRVLDPMCGVATLPIEAAHLQPGAFIVGGDQSEPELKRARENLARTASRAHLARWNAKRLPLTAQCVDVVLCDLPFGVRVGSHRKNVHLYPPVMQELARIVRAGGRVVLLSLERRLIQRRVEKDGCWQCESQFPIHYGGLDPTVFVLQRL